jgi:hypothetical protein
MKCTIQGKIVDTVSKICPIHGIHCWHMESTYHADFETVYKRICCWCGQRDEEHVAHTIHNGWSYNPNEHPEHGNHVYHTLTFVDKSNG